MAIVPLWSVVLAFGFFSFSLSPCGCLNGLLSTYGSPINLAGWPIDIGDPSAECH